MRDKVLKIFEINAEGGSVAPAIDSTGLKRGLFYKFLRENPDLQQLYYEIQRSKADAIVDEAYQISMNDKADPRLARVQAEIRLKIAATYDRQRFGDKIAVEHDAGPNLMEALEAAKSRALLPPRDPGKVTDAEYTEIPAPKAAEPSDKQSEVSPDKAEPGDVDIFEE